MRGSRIAAEIVEEMKLKEYCMKEAQRNKCIVDNKKQCGICKYKEVCDNSK